MNNENHPISKTVFSTMDVLFFALLAGQIIYFFVGMLLIQTGKMECANGLNTIFMFITPVVILSSLLASKFIYTKQVTKFDKSLSLEIKLISYRTANMVRLALLESTNIFNISVMIITSNYFFAALFIIVIVLFFLNRPAKEKFIVEYKISADDALKILS